MNRNESFASDLFLRYEFIAEIYHGCRWQRARLSRQASRRKKAAVDVKIPTWRVKCPQRTSVRAHFLWYSRPIAIGELRVTSALYSGLRALMQASGIFAPFLPSPSLGQSPPFSISHRPLARSSVAKRKPHARRFSALSSSQHSRPFYSRAEASCAEHHERTAESDVVIARRQRGWL